MTTEKRKARAVEGPFAPYRNTEAAFEKLRKHIERDHKFYVDFPASGYTTHAGLVTISYCLAQAVLIHSYAHDGLHGEGPE